MTRRRRTPPLTASPSQKRLSFEIPASLQQFSTRARSLATTMAATRNTTNYEYSRNSLASPSQTSPRPRVANAQSTLGQTRPSSQSSTHSASSFSNASRPGQYATPLSLPQKRSFSEYQSVHQSQQSPASGSPQASRSNLPPPNAPNTTAPRSGGRSIPTHDPNLVAQMAARQREENARAKAAKNAPPALPYIAAEPPLSVGEAPSMTSHPNLIAQMVARKRAEAEMHGHRERLARRQQEYRISSSPGAQLSHELNAQTSRHDAPQMQPRTISNPLPAGRTPTMSPLKPPTPIVFAQTSTPQDRTLPALNTQAPPSQTSAAPNLHARTSNAHTPATESASTPATDDSLRPPVVNNNRRPSADDDSLFGSPFSTPIVEFLERATDNAGLREALEPNEVVSNRVDATTAPMSEPSSTRNTRISEPAESASRSQAQLGIPRLFSDKPLNAQSQPQNPNAIPPQSQSPAMYSQPQSNIYPSAQGQAPQFQPQQGGTQPQLAPRQPPVPQAVPYYPHLAGMPGYHRVELNPNWTGGGNHFIATPSPVAPNAYQQPGPPTSMSFNGYPTHAANPYALHQPSLPPAPGPLRTYGTVAASGRVAVQQNQQASNAGRRTDADSIAGINLKFKHATKKGFSVPKR